ncbi:MAG: DUF5685 family protein, partial [Clostridiales bacterium]|nr:DUF5685 family protein [Clostridiales bacterium]
RSCSGFGDGRCTCNPLKKCKFALCSSGSYSKAAAFSIISSYYKIKDDILDNGFVKRNLYRLLLPVFSHWRKKAAKRYPDTDRLVSNMMDMQYEAEHSESSSVDSAAHPTAVMLADLFSSEAENDTDKRVYREFGYHLGRWIYLIDAADDMKKDKKAGSFNPFLNMQNNADADPKFISAVLNQSLARAYDAYNLIEIVDFKGIFDNMMLKGLPTVQNRVISKLYTEGKDE